MATAPPVLPVCLSGPPPSPHLSQRRTGRRELLLLSVSSDGTQSVDQEADWSRFLLLLPSPLLSIHPSPPAATFVAPPPLSCFGGFGFRQPLRLDSPPHRANSPPTCAAPASSYCTSLHGLKIFFVASRKETRFNAPTAFPLFSFFISGENLSSIKCKLCKIRAEQ